MGIQADYTSENGITGNYFNIVRGYLVIAPGTPRVECLVNFYANEGTRRINDNPMAQFQVNVPLSYMPIDIREMLYPALKEVMGHQVPGFSSAIITDVLSDTPFKSLDEAKARKKAEITAAKMKANRTSFDWNGHTFQADDASMLELQTTMQGVLARGTFRDDWVGGWLDINNEKVLIPDVATWYDFFGAIEATGTRNFLYSHELKRMVDDCTAINQINAIQWGIDPNTFVLPEPRADDFPIAEQPAQDTPAALPPPPGPSATQPPEEGDSLP